MTLSSRRFGAVSALIQIVAIAIYLVLLMHQHNASDDSLSHHLLAISVRMILVSAVVSVIGVFVDKRKALSVISLLATLPIVLLMAGWQGIW
jgi:hypothetical protein